MFKFLIYANDLVQERVSQLRAENRPVGSKHLPNVSRIARTGDGSVRIAFGKCRQPLLEFREGAFCLGDRALAVDIEQWERESVDES